MARGFTGSREFIGRGLTDDDFLNVLYSAFFNRPADAGGFASWEAKLDAGMSRAAVVDGFIGSREFANLAASYGIRAQGMQSIGSNAPVITGTAEADFLRGGAGDSAIFNGGTSVTEVASRETQSQIFRLYEATLAREPNADGLSDWLTRLTTGG